MLPKVFLFVGFQTHLLFISKGKLFYFFVQCIGQHYTEIIRDRELRLFSYGMVITANCVRRGEIQVNI